MGLAAFNRSRRIAAKALEEMTEEPAKALEEMTEEELTLRAEISGVDISRCTTRDKAIAKIRKAEQGED